MACHRSHTSPITTNRSPTKYLLVCPRNQVGSESHSFWETKDKLFVENLLPVHPKTEAETRKVTGLKFLWLNCWDITQVI